MCIRDSANDVRPFGTLQDVYDVDYEWINHSMAPAEVANHDYRITIGEGCAQPYSASVFNISAMSFGALSAAAIRALNGGAKRGGFYHDTGEGSISPYHREAGGALAVSYTHLDVYKRQAYASGLMRWEARHGTHESFR